MADGRGDEGWGTVLRGSRRAGAVGFAGRLDRWVADARIDAAALERSRERWLVEVAAQEATLAGLLAELAERGTPVSLHTTSDRRHHGTLQVVGADFVSLRSGSRSEVLVALAAVGVVRPSATAPTLGDGLLGTRLRLVDVVTELAADRERVLIVTRTGDAVSGELQSVGHDVVVVRADAEGPRHAYVAAAAISEVAIS